MFYNEVRSKKFTLLTSKTSNGSGDVIASWYGGRGVFSAEGTFDSATITLEIKESGMSEWKTVGEDSTVDASKVAMVTLPKSCQIRATVSSAGASTDVSASIQELPE